MGKGILLLMALPKLYWCIKHQRDKQTEFAYLADIFLLDRISTL